LEIEEHFCCQVLLKFQYDFSVEQSFMLAVVDC
jgi:hypothetical protein